MKRKQHWTINTSMILGGLWLLFSILSFMSSATGINSADGAEQIGTIIGLGMILPYLSIATIGTILHLIGGLIGKKGLFLAGLILECVAIFLMPLWGFGYILVIIFGFIGYGKFIVVSKESK